MHLAYTKIAKAMFDIIFPDSLTLRSGVVEMVGLYKIKPDQINHFVLSWSNRYGFILTIIAPAAYRYTLNMRYF